MLEYVIFYQYLQVIFVFVETTIVPAYFRDTADIYPIYLVSNQSNNEIATAMKRSRSF